MNDRAIGESSEGFTLMRREMLKPLEFVQVADELVPNPGWFWDQLCDYCVPECCGAGAYDLSHAAIRSVCEAAGEDEAVAFALDLRCLAEMLRATNRPHMVVGWFNLITTAAANADFLTEIAEMVETPLPETGGQGTDLVG